MKFWLPLLCSVLTCSAAWQYDWSVRTDPHGMPAGILTNTPWPLTESSSYYVVTNDEYPTGRTFFLGTKYYVDGAVADDTGNGAWATPFKTIGHALTDVGNGNNTILVRGAHDAFDGVYNEYDLTMPMGTGDTNRYMVCGYGQERPILDGGGQTSWNNGIFHRSANSNAFYTIQRLQLRNSWRPAIYIGGDNSNTVKGLDSWVYAIDLHSTNCTMYPATDANPLQSRGDGGFYMLNVSNGWFYHCLAEHTMGHGFKMGDGGAGSSNTIEFCYARGCGWWTTNIYAGDPFPTNWGRGTHPAGFDMPADNFQRSFGNTVRYNISQSTLMYGIHMRNGTGYQVHDNEVSLAMNVDYITNVGLGLAYDGKFCVDIKRVSTDYPEVEVSGRFYNNVIRDAGSSNSYAVYYASTDLGTNYIYNNQIYGCYGAIQIATTTTNTAFYILNNSCYVQPLLGNNVGAILLGGDSSARVFLWNNIITSTNTGYLVRFMANSYKDHRFNRYYNPNNATNIWAGSAHALDSSESTNAPGWSATPETGGYSALNFKLASALPGTNLSAFFTEDFTSVPRGSTWDMGALNYSHLLWKSRHNSKIIHGKGQW